jgi:4-amino-4-deoxy-L-arabinose transferase-like glycosyltransferase
MASTIGEAPAKKSRDVALAKGDPGISLQLRILLQRIPGPIRLPLFLAATAFLIHLVCNPHYGFFGDELYFIICGRHPQWNYVDQPPVVPLLAAASQVFGPSLVLLRALPALFAGAGIYVTCLIVVELGGAAYAQITSSIVVFFLPVLTDFGMKVSPDMVGLLSWPLLALWIVRLSKGANPRLWIAIGMLMGISIESKYSVLFFAVALLMGLLFTPQRRILYSRWFTVGALISAVIALPAFLWQVHYGYPMLELLRAVQQGKNVIVGPLSYIGQQLLVSGFLAGFWIIGLVWLLFRANFRFLAYGYVCLIAIMIVLHGKHYYPANVYPYLVAAGCVQLEAWTRKAPKTRVAVAAATVMLGLAFFPIVEPVLPEPVLAKYHQGLLAVLHISRQSVETEHRKAAALPSDFASMHGWTELTSIVTGVYQALPPADRKQAVVMAQNYSEAAAIEFLSKPKLPVISGHNQYFLWGPRGYSGDILICVGDNCGSVAQLFRTCSLKARLQAPWIQPSEFNIPIMVCRGIKRPIWELWPQAKFYN